MPDIPSIGQDSVGPVNRTAGTSSFAGTPRLREHREPQSDRVELSDHVRLLDRLRQMPNVRTDLVNAVRRAVADGTYETPEKLEVAVARLLEELRA